MTNLGEGWEAAQAAWLGYLPAISRAPLPLVPTAPCSVAVAFWGLAQAEAPPVPDYSAITADLARG